MKKEFFFVGKKVFFVVLIALFVFLCVLIFVSSSTNKGHLTLLTVAESQDVVFGGTADLLLEIRPGSGKVFIDSFPLTKIDTQISTRFAKDTACNFLEMDCSNKDFLYTIRAGSDTVGGPSAGSAVTLLTISLLSGQKLDKDTVITGTINSGGIIGPVSGIEKKAEAARDAGFTKILVPKRSILSTKTSEFFLNDSDKEVNLTIFYSDNLEKEGIMVVPVSTLEDALFEFTGKKYGDYSYEIVVSDEYQKVMGDVAKNLCDRVKTIEVDENFLRSKQEVFSFVNETKEQVFIAMNNQDFYSAASFCFTINTALRRLQYVDFSEEMLEQRKNELLLEINSFIVALNKKDLVTMSDLETMMIVKERIFEAKNALEKNEDILELDIGYVEERIHSAEAWSKFFEMGGKKVVLDNEHLRDACLSKISEAEEKLRYVEYMTNFNGYADELKDIRSIYESGDYAFCLFRASKIKAEANSMILTFAITKEKVSELIEDQLALARIQINKQKDSFPIMGYSYFNYASSLKNSRPELAVMFSEYASEFSNLDMYFPRDDKNVFSFLYVNPLVRSFLLSFLSGFFIGMLFLFMFISKNPKKDKIFKKNVKKR